MKNMIPIIDTTSKIQQTDINNMELDKNLLPSALHGQIEKLDELDQQIKKAIAAAENAKGAADKAKQRSVGWFNKKEVIEGLQQAGIDLANAVQSGVIPP